MFSVLYEDKDILVAEKPAGLESQSARSFAPDMVSEIRRHLSTKLSTSSSTALFAGRPPYVGVIHRLDKPVSGVMVYALNQKAAASLSSALQSGKIEKHYLAVICGKPVDNQGVYVDYLLQNRKNNTSSIVDKSVKDSKKCVLNYKTEQVIHREEQGEDREFSLVDIELLTGRHHQIRVQFSERGTPLYGDVRYGGEGCKEGGSVEGESAKRRSGERHEKKAGLALCAYRLAFPHPATGKRMEFSVKPSGGAFDWFNR